MLSHLFIQQSLKPQKVSACWGPAKKLKSFFIGQFSTPYCSQFFESSGNQATWVFKLNFYNKYKKNGIFSPNKRCKIADIGCLPSSIEIPISLTLRQIQLSWEPHLKQTLWPSRNDKRGLFQRENKWNFNSTYTWSTFPFTVSVFFAPPRFGSGSTDRELQAICASDSVV